MDGPALASGEWRRAQECLGAATVCRDSGFHADAVSRAYYAILHAAKAALTPLLMDAGESMPDSHEAVINRFGLYLVMKGEVEREWGSYLGQSLRLRLQADYDINVVFSETDSREAVERAASFLNRMQSLLGTALP